MPRLNIDDSIYSDYRFLKLLFYFNCPDKTIGHLINAWRLAQKHWLQHELIPIETWAAIIKSDILIEVGLAVKTERGIYVCGTRDKCAWILQRRAAGSSSAKKRAHLKLVKNNDPDCEDP